ncbi:MAG: hypothetical protein BRD57_00955 [Proteobacteria bacterium SW_6_67_9]|nr:MAG: hypothetical protein BRD57_00955 [Proteobacteria bacterium SW_6_67_9]
MRDDDSAIEDLADAVRGARTVTVLTGSGLSAPSGVATFRDADDGLWSRYRPEDVATPEAFARDPARVWQWYRARRRQLAWYVHLCTSVVVSVHKSSGPLRTESEP